MSNSIQSMDGKTLRVGNPMYMVSGDFITRHIIERITGDSIYFKNPPKDGPKGCRQRLAYAERPSAIQAAGLEPVNA